MQPIPSLSLDEDRLLKLAMGHYDVPAYVRRARRMQEALDDLLSACNEKRDEWLGMVRTRLATLHALAGDWAALRPHLADNREVETLAELHGLLQPGLRSFVETTNSPRLLRFALRELCESLHRFNQRWRSFVAKVDLSPINESREGYNRYYVLEKECATRSATAARHGFKRLEPFTLSDLVKLLPELPVPQLAS